MKRGGGGQASDRAAGRAPQNCYLTPPAEWVRDEYSRKWDMVRPHYRCLMILPSITWRVVWRVA
jgi:hypothetical protein